MSDLIDMTEVTFKSFSFMIDTTKNAAHAALARGYKKGMPLLANTEFTEQCLINAHLTAYRYRLSKSAQVQWSIKRTVAFQ